MFSTSWGDIIIKPIRYCFWLILLFKFSSLPIVITKWTTKNFRYDFYFKTQKNEQFGLKNLKSPDISFYFILSCDQFAYILLAHVWIFLLVKMLLYSCKYFLSALSLHMLFICFSIIKKWWNHGEKSTSSTGCKEKIFFFMW